MFHYFLQENDLVLLFSSPNFWLEEWWLPECNCCSYSSQKRSRLVGYYFCEWEMVTVWAECIIVMYWCTMGQYFSFYVCHELQNVDVMIIYITTSFSLTSFFFVVFLLSVLFLLRIYTILSYFSPNPDSNFLIAPAKDRCFCSVTALHYMGENKHVKLT